VLHKLEGAEFTCEFKYDGERAQIQCSESGDISIFSRNQENNTSKYPDIISRIGSCLAEETKSFMLDCEVVAWDVEKEQILPFQVNIREKFLISYQRFFFVVIIKAIGSEPKSFLSLISWFRDPSFNPICLMPF
jgi:hypothetical protein